MLSCPGNFYELKLCIDFIFVISKPTNILLLFVFMKKMSGLLYYKNFPFT